jgi:putative FmdB family regulatory protein
MPLYEYECDSCGHRFEKIQRFSDKPIEKCPVCEGPVRKLFSSPAIQFKGSGWYITDYAKKGGGDRAKTSDGDKPAEKTEKADKSESSSEKPAAKPAESPKTD